MASRNKSQARRSGGPGAGLPGWAWLVIGVTVTLLAVLVAPRLFKPGSDGFFKPTPNPDAQPQPVVEDAVVDPERDAPATVAAPPEEAAPRSTQYDFYRLLPGQETPITDAELAASEQAERGREPTAPPATPEADATPAPDTDAPATAGTPAAPAPATRPAPTAVAQAEPEPARYVLQAGAFEASGQAEEMKAKIAMLGLPARVESARIDGRTVYRVRMGPYGSATELAEAKRALAGGGLPAIAVKTQ